MKKQLLVLGLLVGASLTSIAQTPEMSNKSVVWKFTETWCGPCGSWGWDLANSIIADIGDKGYYVGVMGSSSPSSMNMTGYSTFETNFPIVGYPTFVVNNMESGTYLSTVKPNYVARAAEEVIASSAAYFDIVGTTVNVKANSKFWKASSGDFYVAAYIIEDKVMATQNGKTGTVAHHSLMRGPMTTSNWGESISTGSVAADAMFTNTFSAELKAGWKAEDVSVLVVIYKKEGAKYNLVNSIMASPSPASINNISELNGVSLYPNPNSGNSSNLELDLSQNSKLAVRVTDISGRIVYSLNTKQYNAGKTMITFPVDQLANGIYNVTVYNETNGTMNQSMVISK